MSTARPAQPGAQGFTLIELMVTVSVLASILALAVPSFARFIHRWQQDAAVSTFVGDLRLARSTATRTSRPTVVCPRQANTCGRAQDWAEGWLVFSDLDGDGQLDPGEPLIAQRAAPAGLASITGPASLRFRNNGTLHALTASVSIRAKGADANLLSKDIDISASGRISVESLQTTGKGEKQP